MREVRTCLAVLLALSAIACGDAGERPAADDAGEGGSGAHDAGWPSGGSSGATTGGAGGNGGSAGSTGGSAGSTGGSAGSTGGNAGSMGGSAGSSGGGAGAGGGGAGCFDVAESSADWAWPDAEGDHALDAELPELELETLALTQTLRQPFAQTSFICQSYRGYSHASGYAFDIGVTPQSCNAGNNDSGGKDIVAPANGKVTKLPTSGLGAYLCIQLDGGGAVALGHVKAASGMAVGTAVKKGQKVATVAHASDTSSGNGGIAHLHFEAFDGTGCYNGNPKPFTGAFRMDCAPDLPFNATYGHYNGTKLTPCPTAGAERGDVAMLYALDSTSARIYAWTSNAAKLSLQTSQWSGAGYALDRVGDRMVAGDFDGDGKDDIAAAMQMCDGTLRIHTWKSTGTTFSYGGSDGWSNAPLDPSSAAGRFVAGDFSGDDKDEVALLHAPAGGGVAIRVFPGNVTAWSVSSGYSLSNVGDRFVAGDFDGNGKDDVAAAYQYPDGTFRFHVWLASSGKLAYQGSGGWYQSGQYSLSPVSGRIAAGDFDGDGKDDIAMLRNNGSSGAKLWVWRSTGSSFALQSTSWSVSSGYSLANVGDRFAAIDLDDDGRADAVTAYQYPDGTFRYHVWKGTGTTMSYAGATGWYTSGPFTLSKVSGRLVTGNWNGD